MVLTHTAELCVRQDKGAASSSPLFSARQLDYDGNKLLFCNIDIVIYGNKF